MAVIKYDLADSLYRIDLLLNGNPDTQGKRVDLPEVAHIPDVFNQKYTLVVAKVNFRFDTSDYKLPGMIHAALLNELREIAYGWEQCKMVSVTGSRIIALYQTIVKSDVVDVVNMVGNMSGIVDIVNYKCKNLDINRIGMKVSVNYGSACLLSYGDARCNVMAGDKLMEENELQMDDSSSHSVFISEIIYNNLKDDYKQFFSGGGFGVAYSGNIINTGMSKWLESQK